MLANTLHLTKIYKSDIYHLRESCQNFSSGIAFTMPFTHDAARCDSVVELVQRDSQETPPPAEGTTPGTKTNGYGWRFWTIFAGLALSALLSGLEGSIIATALPTILADLGSGEDYVWVINIYFLTRCADPSLHCKLINKRPLPAQHVNPFMAS